MSSLTITGNLAWHLFRYINVKQFKLNIPNPCHEDWNQMTETQKGAFCKACSKEVLDFSKMTDEQLIEQLSQNFNSSGSCGRFNSNQLQRYYSPITSKKHNSTNWYMRPVAFLFGIMGLTIPFGLKAQNVQNAKSAKENKTDIQSEKFEIAGIVIDHESGEAIPYASISIFEDSTYLSGSTSDFNGKFRIKLNREQFEQNKFTIQFGHLGYKTLKVKNDFSEDHSKHVQSIKDLVIALKSDGSTNIEEVEVVVNAEDYVIKVGMITMGQYFPNDQIRRSRSLNDARNWHYEFNEEQYGRDRRNHRTKEH